MLRRFARAGLFLALGFGIAGCASVSVRKNEVQATKTPHKVPEKIFIKPFGFNEEELRVDRGGKQLEEFRFEAQERLTRHLVKRLRQQVAPAEAIAATAPLPRGNYWLITGRIDRMYQGSRLGRAVVGFGIGGTKMETTALIWDLSGREPRPFLLVETTGGSNASPGAIGAAGFFISGVTALASLGNLIEGVRSGVTFDTIRTTKELSAVLSEYLYLQGAIPRKEAFAPKRLGDWHPNTWPFIRRPRPLPATGTITVDPVPSTNP